MSRVLRTFLLCVLQLSFFKCYSELDSVDVFGNPSSWPITIGVLDQNSYTQLLNQVSQYLKNDYITLVDLPSVEMMGNLQLLFKYRYLATDEQLIGRFISTDSDEFNELCKEGDDFGCYLLFDDSLYKIITFLLSKVPFQDDASEQLEPLLTKMSDMDVLQDVKPPFVVHSPEELIGILGISDGSLIAISYFDREEKTIQAPSGVDSEEGEGEQNVNSIFVLPDSPQKKYLMVDDEGALTSGGTTKISSKSQFIVDLYRDRIGLRSPLFANRYLSVPEVPDFIEEDGIFSTRKHNAKLRFDSTSFSSRSADHQHFVLEQLGRDEPPGTYYYQVDYGTFSLRNVAVQGCLRKDNYDGYVRVYNSNFQPLPNWVGFALDLNIEILSSFHSRMAAIKNESSIKAKLEEYENIISDGQSIDSYHELKLFIEEIKQMMIDANASRAGRRDLLDNEDRLVGVLVDIWQNFSAEWDREDIKDYLEKALGSKQDLQDAQTYKDLVGVIKDAELFTSFTEGDEIDFSTLSYQQKILDLEARANLVIPGEGEEESLKEDLTSVVSDSVLVEAFPEDIITISNIVDLLRKKKVFAGDENYLDGIIESSKDNIPYSEYLSNLESTLNKKPIFDQDLKNNFLKKVERLVNNTGKIPAGQEENEIKKTLSILERASYNQMSEYSDQIDSAMQSIASGLSAVKLITSYSQEVSDLIDLFTKVSSDNTLALFFASLERLVDQRLDASEDDIESLLNLLSEDELIKNSYFYFYNQGGINALELVEQYRQQLLAPVDISLRILDLQNLVKKMHDSAGDEGTDNKKLSKLELSFMTKLMSVVKNRSMLTVSHTDDLVNILKLVRTDVMKDMMGETPENFAILGDDFLEYNDKKLSFVFDDIIRLLRGGKRFGDLSYSGQVQFLLDEGRTIKNQDELERVELFLNRVNDLVKRRLEASPLDVDKLNAVLNLILWNEVIDSKKYFNDNGSIKVLTEGNNKVSHEIKTNDELVDQWMLDLNNDLRLEDIYNYLKDLVGAAEDGSFDSIFILPASDQEDFIEKSFMLLEINDVLSIDLINEVVDFLQKIKFNFLDDSYTSSIDRIIGQLEAKKSDQFKNYSQRIDDFYNQLVSLQTSGEAKHLIEVVLRKLLLDRLSASSQDLERLSEILLEVQWNRFLTGDMRFSFELIESVDKKDLTIQEVIDDVNQYLLSSISFQDRYDSLLKLSGLLLSDQEKNMFLNQAKTLNLSFDDLRDSDNDTSNNELINDAIKLLNEVRFNDMRAYQNELGLVVSELESLKRELEKNLPESYDERVEKIKVTVSNSGSLTQGTLPKFIDDLRGLYKDRAYAKEADLQDLQQFLESKTYTNHETIFWRGGREAVEEQVGDWRVEIPFEEHYKSFSFLVEMASKDIVSDYFNEVILEKLSLFERDADKFAKNNLPVDRFAILIEILKDVHNQSKDSDNPLVGEDSLFGDLGFSGYLNKVLDEVKTRSRDVFLFNLTYSQRLERAEIDFENLRSRDNAVALFSLLDSLVSKRLEALKGNREDLESLRILIDRISVDSTFITLYESGEDNNAKIAMGDLLQKLDVPISNLDRALWLIDTLEEDMLPNFYHSLVISVASDYINQMDSDLSGNNILSKVQEALNLASYSTLSSYKAELDPIIDYLDTVVQGIGETGVSLNSLFAQLNNMSNVSDLKVFLEDASKLIDKKFDLSVDDIEELNLVLSAVELRNEYLDHKSRVFSGQITYEGYLQSLVDNLNKEVSFKEIYEDLKKIYNPDTFDIQGGLSLSDQDKFMIRANQAINKIESAKVDDDDKKDEVELFAQTIERAAYNEMSGYRTQLLSLVEQARNKRQELLSVRGTSQIYRSRIDSLSEELNDIKDNGAEKFIELLNDLVLDRVDSVGDDLDQFKKFLMSSDLRTNEDLFNMLGNFDFADRFIEELEEPISLVDRVTNIRAFVESNENFNDKQKQLFVDKVKAIFENRWKAESERFNLSSVRSLLDVVIANRFNSKKDINFINDLEYYSNNLFTEVSLVDREGISHDYQQGIDKAKDIFRSLTEEVFLNEFLPFLDLLIKYRANSVENDEGIDQVQDLSDWLLSREVQLDPVIFEGNYQDLVREKAEAVLQDSSYYDLYETAKQLVSDHQFFNAFLRDLFVKKVKKLAERRGLASSENFDITLVENLIDYVIEQRVRGDSVIIDQLGNIKQGLRISAEVSFHELEKDLLKKYFKVMSNDEVTLSSFSIDPGQNITFYGRGKDKNKESFELEEVSFGLSEENVLEFLDLIANLVAKKVDARIGHLNSIIGLLKSDFVQKNKVLFLYDNQSARKTLNALIAQLEEERSFYDLVNNFIDEIEKTDTFEDMELKILRGKLDHLVDERGRAYDEGVDLKNLQEWVLFAAEYRINNSAEQEYFISKAEELLDPLDQLPDEFISYSELVANLESELGQYRNTNTREDEEFITAFLSRLSPLVSNRLDGIRFDTETREEADNGVESLRDLLDRLLFDPKVRNKAPERTVSSYLRSLNTEISYSEMINDFVRHIESFQLFAPEHEELFINKLERIVSRRSEVSSDSELENIIDNVKFAKINKFIDLTKLSSGDETSLESKIDSLVDRLKTPAEEEELNRRIQEANEFLSDITEKNFEDISIDEKAGWLSDFKYVAYGVDENTPDTILKEAEDVLISARSNFFPYRVETQEDIELEGEIQALIDRVRSFENEAS